MYPVSPKTINFLNNYINNEKNKNELKLKPNFINVTQQSFKASFNKVFSKENDLKEILNVVQELYPNDKILLNLLLNKCIEQLITIDLNLKDSSNNKVLGNDKMLALYKSLFEDEATSFEVLEERLHCIQYYFTLTTSKVHSINEDADQTSNCCNFLAWLFYT